MADPLDEATEREAKDMLGGVELNVVTATLTEVRDAIHHAHAPALVPLVAVPAASEAESARVVPLVLAAALAAAFLLVATTTGVVLTQPTVVAARANLTIFQGSVDVRHGSGGYEAASTSDLCSRRPRSAPLRARTALTFFDRSVVVLEPTTEVVVETLRTVSGGRDIDLVLRQLQRNVNVVAHSIGDDGRFEVVTPTSTNTVHGTAFQVRVDEQGAPLSAPPRDGPHLWSRTR